MMIFNKKLLKIAVISAMLAPATYAGYKPVALTQAEVPYSIGVWKSAYGNHRAVVEVKSTAKAVKVTIPWRRRDTDAAEKNVIVVDAKTGQEIANREIVKITRESGEIIFEPTSGAGTYEVYYLIRQRKPNPIKGPNQGHFPGTVYQAIQKTASENWLKSVKSGKLSEASVKEIQALKVSGPEKFADFNSFYPMEVVATDAETSALEDQYSDDAFVIFPESRKNAIRMTHDLPLKWIKQGPKNEFTATADKNEFFTFQLGLYALKDVNGVDVKFADLKGPNGATIPAAALRCFNMGGINYNGKRFKKIVNVPASDIQALWFGLDVPAKAATGTYTGTVEVIAEGVAPVKVALNINVSDKYLADKGDSDLSRLSRLRWLDSDIGLDNEVLAPFTPVKIDGQKLDILGRTVKLGKNGLPSSVVSRISMTEITKNGREVLDKPVDFVVETSSGKVNFTPSAINYTMKEPGKVAFETTWKSADFNAQISGTLECDGYMRYRVALSAQNDAEVKDIRIELPFRKTLAKYLMARMGPKNRIWKDVYSGARPATAEAPIEKGLMYNVVWSGDYNAGLGMQLKNDKDEWNGDNKSKQQVPTLPGWENNGRGKYTLKEVGNTALICAHNGSRTMKAGETVNFNFSLMVTPFKPITKDHWDYRIYHAPYETEVKLQSAANARVVNVHHANSHNPYINYPFLRDDYLKSFIKEAHGQGRKVKLYYTIRELTTRVAEFWALRSLGEEIFIKDDGYLGLKEKPLSIQRSRFHRAGYPWLCEHIVEDYRMRWHSYIKKTDNPAEARIIGRETDASIATQGLCRWHNYYLEGMKYLMKDIGADGIYLDGIGYDREIMKRVRKSMLLSGKTPMIDFHGAVHMSWMTLAPYIDSIWNGEGTRYDFGPDYWLVEISGIPFGLTGEILKSDRHANIHRGMLYGISKRLGWRGNRQSEHVWKLWDDFGIKDSKQIGYFEPNNPVQTDNENVKATVYVKDGKTLLALASWSKNPETVKLKIDWNKLGLDPSKVKMMIPEVKTMQKAGYLETGKTITVPAFNGLLIILEEK